MVKMIALIKKFPLVDIEFENVFKDLLLLLLGRRKSGRRVELECRWR
jgi:hypothetical protein